MLTVDAVPVGAGRIFRTLSLEGVESMYVGAFEKTWHHEKAQYVPEMDCLPRRSDFHPFSQILLYDM